MCSTQAGLRKITQDRAIASDDNVQSGRRTFLNIYNIHNIYIIFNRSSPQRSAVALLCKTSTYDGRQVF